jgi:hypothetical protein
MGMAQRRGTSDDPRRLRELLARTCLLAAEQSVRSVVVGLAAGEGDLLFPELVDFVESALRVEDSIFRMTRERAVLFLADVDRQQASHVIERLLTGFRERFPSAVPPELSLGFFEISPRDVNLTLKEVLPAVFGGEGRTTH